MSAVCDKYFILLVKKLQVVAGLSTPTVTRHVFPGTLLKWVCLVDENLLGTPFCHVFRTVHDDYKVNCIPGEAEEVDSVTVDLLQSIACCSDRLSVYNDKKWLTEGKTITSGDDVYVKIKIDGSEIDLPGVVRYRGRVPDLKGIFFGVELAGSGGKGTSDGVYHKKRFFKCAEDGAIFCALNKIRHKYVRPVTGCNLVIGERVVAWIDNYPRLGNPKELKYEEEGTVKWIGFLPDSRTKDITVGVEFDNPVGIGTGNYNDHRLFYARQNHAALLPVSVIGVIKSDTGTYYNTNTTLNVKKDNINLDVAVQSKLKKFPEKNSCLVKESGRLVEENGKLLNENNSDSAVQSKLKKLQEENRCLVEENSRLVEENKKILNELNSNSVAQSELSKLQEKYSRLVKENRKLSGKNNKHELELLDESFTMKSVNVDMYSPGESSTIDKMEVAFKNNLHNLFLKQNIQLNINMVSSLCPLKQPAIVLCPSFSTIGTDVNTVFYKYGSELIQDLSKGIALVIIHSKEERNLPKVKSEQLLSINYGHLGIILDMAFTEKRGFYACKINQSSSDALLHFFNERTK